MNLAEILWGKKAKFYYLFITAFFILFAFLGTREIWTQEHRWADIVANMFYRHDFLHPYLGNTDYYDKPLLSYWFIAFLSFITGKLTVWTLRIPTALAGILAIVSIYQLGKTLKNKNLGFLSGWLLLTTFYFIFWARTSSADMLNMAGSLFAVYWYFDKKENPSFFTYAIFFLVIALTSLCKGLIGAIVPILVILIDLLHHNSWKHHLRISLLLGIIPGLIIYFLPFWASSNFASDQYHQNGLYLVYRENILRYFQPFDHKGPIYTYLLYLPIYLLPWAVLFVPALLSIKKRWNHLTWNSKWLVWSVIILFTFFTLSGSRRTYYVLPIVPFAILLTADWLLTTSENFRLWLSRFLVFFIGISILIFNLLQPIYYTQNGIANFAMQLQIVANKIKPWHEWEVVLLDPESKVRFYLNLPPDIKIYDVDGEREQQTKEKLIHTWPFILDPNNKRIFVTRHMYEPILKDILTNYKIVELNANLSEKIFKNKKQDMPVAFIPIS